MNQILSNNEIAQVVHDIDCAKVRPFDIEFARAIEQAILNKLSEQEPVEIEYPDYHHSGMVCDLEDQGITDRYQAMKYGWDCAIGAMQERIPEDLFEQPIPSVPEGWAAIHLKTGNEYRVIGEAIDATNMHCNQLMVIYQRDGKTFVREAEEFQEKFKASLK